MKTYKKIIQIFWDNEKKRKTSTKDICIVYTRYIGEDAHRAIINHVLQKLSIQFSKQFHVRNVWKKTPYRNT